MADQAAVAIDASKDGTEEAPPEDGSKEAVPISAEAAKIKANMKARKRTKTGCLTCRKRRIKCDEERPVCANCIKAKRSCEGYAHRYTFKDPLGAFTTWNRRGIAPIRSDPPITSSTQAMISPSAQAGQSQFPIIAPRPIPLQSPVTYAPTNQSQTAWSQGQSQPSLQSPAYDGATASSLQPVAETEPSNQYQPPSTSSPSHLSVPNSAAWPDQNYALQPNEQYFSQPSSTYNVLTSTADQLPYSPHQPWDPSNMVGDGVQASSYHAEPSAAYISTLDGTAFDISGAGETSHSTFYNVPARHVPLEYMQPSSSAMPHAAVQSTDQSQVFFAEETEDDPYDVDSDDEVPVPARTSSNRPEHDYGLMLALSASREDQALRSYYTFLHKPDILATYIPQYSASPLMDSTTARIFCHFITATAPYLSIFERHPVNPWVIFSGKPVPRASQAVWTYILPMLAMSNQSLLQSMLALASLQISRLQQTTPTASMRHYHFALRKVAKAVASPSKRATIPTLAATLLLGHFEATTAEHSKWSSHLAGARQLFMEVDFKSTARRIKKMSSRQAQDSSMWYHQYVGLQFQGIKQDLPWVPISNGIDEQIVSQLMGWKIRYDEFGSVIEEDNQDDERPPLTEKDLDDFQVYRDLFWFFCKQDCIQSSISGNALLLPYDRWTHCPPRGPIGKIEAIYGTMDHLLLLMGRVCDFAHRDQLRKCKLMAANGGHWRPPPGMFPGPPPGAGPGGPPGGTAPPPGGVPPMGPPGQNPPGASAGGPPGNSPPFFGMMPNPGPSNPPDAFMDAPRDQLYIPPDPHEDFELASATAEAEREWQEIQEAFNVFEQCLGPSFGPLPEDAAPPIDTPFGPAIQYRTYHIASIWSFFYTSKIIAARTHPSMHPATTVAAGMMASRTAAWTNNIGRIALGLQPPSSDQPLNPSFGAALTESMLSLFFAGVCFVDAAQRAATIQRLRLIAERVGTESAALIAAGLETVWIKMFKAGRGPPYTKTLSITNDEVDLGRKMARRYAASTENNIVYVPEKTRENWGSGIMGVEEDFDNMSLTKRLY